jgi:hypothetical protein
MDYSPKPNPEEPKKKTSFEEFLEEEREKEEQRKRNEALNAKANEDEGKKESIFSFKKRIDGAAEKATKKLEESEPDADLRDKKSIKKVVEGMAKSEDLSPKEKEVISKKQKKITERTAELLDNQADSKSLEDSLNLSPDQALSLAISEQIAEEDNSQIENAEQALVKAPDNDTGTELAEESEPRYKVAEVAGLIISQKLFEALGDSEDVEEGTESNFSDERNYLTEETGEEQDDDALAAGLLETKSKPSAPGAGGKEVTKPKNYSVKLAGILGIKKLFKSSSPKSGSSYGGGGTGGVRTNAAPKLSERTEGGGVEHELKYKTPEKVVESVSVDALLRQIRRQKQDTNGEQQFKLKSEDLQSEAVRVAPIAESAKLSIARDVRIYSDKDSKDIVSTPQELARGWSADSERIPTTPQAEVFSETFVSESITRDDNDAMVMFDRDYDREVVSSFHERGAESPQVMYDRTHGITNESIYPDPDNLESHFTVKSFEKYLEVVTLDTKPINPKQLKKKVAKKLGRPLTLTEQKNVDNFWMKREAKLKISRPDILTGVDHRKEVADREIAQPAPLQGSGSSGSNMNEDVLKVKDAATLNDEDKRFEPVETDAKPAKLNYSSPGANIAMAIFAIAALVFAIIYAIIIMI